MTASGANQATFILSTMIGASKTYADVTRNKREEDYNRCYTSGICKGYAEGIDPNTYRGTY